MTDITLQLSATPTAEGFDILAINAGEAKGHGITFGRDVLMQAVPMYDSLPVFIDHAGLGNAPSVRNLAGTLQTPSWNETEQGIQAKLKASGPAADVLLALREAAKTDTAIMKAVGFSCVVNVQLSKTGAVTKIVRVKSVDVVIDPARGGKFLSVYQGQKGENTMTEQLNTEQAELTKTQAAALELQGANEAIAELQSKQKQADDMLLAQCESLLETSLNASKLPAASQKAIKKQFVGRIFKVAELQTAITEKREELAEISAGSNVQGPARHALSVNGMFTGQEQFEAALADLLEAPRPEGTQTLKVRRLRGIQEAYLLGTGDYDFHGGYYRQNLEYSLVTTNFPGLVADLLNKKLIIAWEDYKDVYGWWMNITGEPEHFTNLNDVKWLMTGTIGSLPTVGERGEYTELPIGDNKETSSWDKYGGYIPITIEAMINDDVRGLKRLPREAAKGGMRNISEQVAAIFTQASGAGPTLTDTGALFNSTAVTTAGGHANLLTTALGTDYTAWEAAASAIYNQPLLVKNSSGNYGTGKKQALDPKFILVPRALRGAANTLFLSRNLEGAYTTVTSGKEWYGNVLPLTVPEWTDATDWAAVADPKYAEGVKIGEIFGIKPQIFSASNEIDPAMFANDESRIKVRQFLTVGVADFRPLHKSNVAG